MANPSSVKPRQSQEGDVTNLGGTAPGGTVAFMSVKGDPRGLDPIAAAHMMHYGAADGAPDVSGNVPIHPGLNPSLFRTPRNHVAPDGQAEVTTDPTADGGRPLSPDGRHRGESPEVLTQTNRGSYRP